MYWFYRAIDEFAVSEYSTQLIGRPENHEANQLAIIKAMRTKLELSEVYGLNDFVTVKGGFKVDLFQALLSLELMTAFFSLDYLLPYQEHLKKTGYWQTALRQLAMNGLLEGMQNRFPIGSCHSRPESIYLMHPFVWWPVDKVAQKLPSYS